MTKGCLISEMGHVAIRTSKIEETLTVATEILGLRITESEGANTYLAGAASEVHHEMLYIEDDIEYEVGGRFGHLSIGREGIVNDQGITLDGSYGVNHIVRIRASNPTQQNARLEIAVRAGGGVARTVAAIDGALRSTKLLLAAQEEMLEQRDLAPGASTRVRLELIPTAGSNLPFTLVVRSRPL